MKRKKKRKRKKFGDAGDVSGSSFQGPWAAFEDEEKIRKQFQEAADASTMEAEKDAPKKLERPKEDKVEEEEGKNNKTEKEVVKAKSILHINVLRDYLGRTFVDPPSHLKQTEHECFLPKKVIHTWEGHTQGVAVIKFTPKYGHLILSGGMDSKVKIWDVYNKQNCIRTYMGH